jgi:hypothetical protein
MGDGAIGRSKDFNAFSIIEDRYLWAALAVACLLLVLWRWRVRSKSSKTRQAAVRTPNGEFELN